MFFAELPEEPFQRAFNGQKPHHMNPDLRPNPFRTSKGVLQSEWRTIGFDLTEFRRTQESNGYKITICARRMTPNTGLCAKHPVNCHHIHQYLPHDLIANGA